MPLSSFVALSVRNHNSKPIFMRIARGKHIIRVKFLYAAEAASITAAATALRIVLCSHRILVLTCDRFRYLFMARFGGVFAFYVGYCLRRILIPHADNKIFMRGIIKSKTWVRGQFRVVH